METEWRTRSARRLAVAGSASLLGAGALLLGAAWIRWGATCGPGLDTQACVAVQDHRYDYLLPGEPWTPIGPTAPLAGLAYLLVAVGMGLVFAAGPAAGWARALQAMLVGSVLAVGAVTLTAAGAGRPVGFEWVILPWLASPMVLASLLVELLGRNHDAPVLSDRAWCVWTGLLVLANPLVEFVLTPMLVGGASYDTAPWDGVVGAGAFASAGVVVLIGLVRSAARGRVPAQR